MWVARPLPINPHAEGRRTAGRHSAGACGTCVHMRAQFHDGHAPVHPAHAWATPVAPHFLVSLKYELAITKRNMRSLLYCACVARTTPVPAAASPSPPPPPSASCFFFIRSARALRLGGFFSPFFVSPPLAFLALSPVVPRPAGSGRRRPDDEHGHGQLRCGPRPQERPGSSAARIPGCLR